MPEVVLIVNVGNEGEGARKEMFYGKEKTVTNQMAWAQLLPLTNYVIWDESTPAQKSTVTY